MMDEHGLHDWTFAWSRSKRALGSTVHNRDDSPGKIVLSSYATPYRTQDEVQQTILHEIAHAMCGHKAGHGPRWRATARRIGYRGGATTTAPTLPPPPIRAWCPEGEHHLGRPLHRRPAGHDRRTWTCSKHKARLQWVDTRTHSGVTP